jgi:hypothetical protein
MILFEIKKRKSAQVSIERRFTDFFWTKVFYFWTNFEQNIFEQKWESFILLHPLIENSSEHNHFNNSSGNVSIPEPHCRMIYVLLSFDFCWTFHAHTPQLSLEVFSWTRCQDANENNPIRRILKLSLLRWTVFIWPCLAQHWRLISTGGRGEGGGVAVGDPLPAGFSTQATAAARRGQAGGGLAACADRLLRAPPQGPPPASVTTNIVSDIVV